MSSTDNPNRCNPSHCEFGASLNRRDLLRAAGAGSFALIASRLPVMAGPFETADFERLAPSDKKLDPAWVQSLFARGEPTVYRGDDLRYIGMPVGGICAGQVYLGGDGSLWHWDIFNEHIRTGDSHYAQPPRPASPLELVFVLKLGERNVRLAEGGFADIAFRGQYPVGTVEYSDPHVPVRVTLEAFSPFIPLNTDDSSLPATIMRFTVHNTSQARVETTLGGSLENAICLHHRDRPGARRNRILAGEGFTFLECSAEEDVTPPAPVQSDVVFENWNKPTYDGWSVEGRAFGTGPIKKSAVPDYQGDVGGDGDRLVNSHATAPGTSVGERDDATGKLSSRRFRIERNFIRFWIGGGEHEGKTCLNLVVDGKVVRSRTGKNDNRMTLQSFDVRDLRGKEAVFEIIDAQQGPWGNVGVGEIIFSDTDLTALPFKELPDYGTMGLALLGSAAEVNSGEQSAPLREQLVGTLGRAVRLEPGQAATVSFIVTWHFPNLRSLPIQPSEQGRHYVSRFDSALAVAKHIVSRWDQLVSETFLWRDTWYDSTLPYWFLDRTFVGTSILATSTCYRFQDGRFWAWEGVGCCEGTCAHVWHYAQAMARQFPELERILRERIDFGLAMLPNGAIRFRGENNDGPAIDAQAGSILRALREHQMSTDDAFLKRIWPGVKKATQWLISQDGNGDGIIEGAQHNTLDTDWYGAVAWLSGLYLAALAASATMADEVGDEAFARTCRGILAIGQKKLVADLFNGEYFYNRVDPGRPEAVNSGTGCEIDQVMGQSWAFQVRLPRVLPDQETRSALRALWRYNFSPDVGPYRVVNQPGRWYAMAGEAGLLMCTFPRADWDYAKAKGKGGGAWAAMYFNECMSGFEYQVAGHMLWEGLVLEGLAIVRAIHDRYHASKRNPWNEVECGDHYARSMAGYGVFLAACGYQYHGPQGHLGFAPRLTPERFRAPFTTAEGWGTFTQAIDATGQRVEVQLRHGSLRLRSLSLAVAAAPKHLVVNLNGKPLETTYALEGDRVLIALAGGIRLTVNDKLAVAIA